MKYKFAGKEPVEIIPVDGYGTYNDYAAAGFNNGYNGGKTGVALVKRGGGISFLDKINNAMSFSGVNWTALPTACWPSSSMTKTPMLQTSFT